MSIIDQLTASLSSIGGAVAAAVVLVLLLVTCRSRARRYRGGFSRVSATDGQKHPEWEEAGSFDGDDDHVEHAASYTSSTPAIANDDMLPVREPPSQLSREGSTSTIDVMFERSSDGRTGGQLAP